MLDVLDPTSQPDQIHALLQELSNETSDLPVERKERIDAALQKIRSCISALASTDEKETLAASETKYRELADSLSDPFVVYDTNLRMVYQNKASAEVTQISNEHALGKTFSELYPSLVGSEVHQVYLRALETHQPQRIQSHWVRPTDGMDYYYDLSIYPTSSGLIASSKIVTDRVQAEMAQRDALEQAAWMVRFPDENPSPVARVSVDGQILYRNQASSDASGWGFQVGEQIPAPFLALVEEANRQEKKMRCDLEVGETVYSIVLMPFPNDQYVNLYGRDITQRKRAEEALEKANNDLINERNRLLAVMEALPVGISILDRSGGVIQTNQALEDVWGRSVPLATSVEGYEIYQAWWVETGQPVKPEEWAGALAVQKGETVTGQFLQIQRFDGTRAYVLNSAAPIRNANGEITGSTVAIMDITPMIEAETALRESQERFRVAVNTAPILVYACDREQRYTWIYNPLRGFRAGDVLGKRDDEVIPPQAAAELIAAKQRALDSGQGGIQEVKVPLNGEDTYYILTTDPIRDHHGNVTGLTCSAIDITVQKRLQAEQQELAIQNEVQRRLMEQRERDRHAIARDLHDGPIQTLSSITFNLHMIKEVFPEPALKTELDHIGMDVKNTIQELRGVLNDLRPPALMQFGFSKVVRMHAEDFRERFPDIELNLDVVDDDKILSNEAHLTLFRIYQAGINNIIRHSGATKIWVVYKIEQGCFFLELSDNGKGFELSQDLSQLTRGGHFGLVGMKERAEAIGGELTVFSEPHHGTKIVVKGPCIGKNLK